MLYVVNLVLSYILVYLIFVVRDTISLLCGTMIMLMMLNFFFLLETSISRFFSNKVDLDEHLDILNRNC